MKIYLNANNTYLEPGLYNLNIVGSVLHAKLFLNFSIYKKT